MSPQLQIILAFAIVLLVPIILAIFLKKSRTVWIVSAISIVPVAVFAVLLSGFVLSDPAEDQLAAKEEELSNIDSSDYIDLADALLTRGLTRTAEKTLDEYASLYPVGGDYMLSRARLDALRGNYDSAQGIFAALIKNGKIDEEDVSSELAALNSAISGSGTHNEVVGAVVSGIKHRELSDHITRTVDTFALIDHMDASSASASKAASAAAEFASILEDNPSMAFPSPFETGYLKALMISGDYPTIIERSLQYNDSHEMLMMGELLRENKITEEDVAQANEASKDRPRNEKVINWIKDQKESQDYGEDAVTLDRAVNTLSHSVTDSKETYEDWLVSRITTLAETPGERESSKLYMELAYLDHSDGDDTGSAVNIRKALVSGADSEDLSYIAPIDRINEILENKDDTEALKEVDEYVRMMVANMQTEEMKPDSGTDLNVDLSDFADSVTEDLVSDSYDSDTDSYDDDTDSDYDDTGDDNVDSGISSPGDSEFSDFVSTQVNQITASINIASIDHSEFEKVSSIIALDESIASDAEEFKKNIDLFDCDLSVDSYQVEKLNDAGVNVILVCDNSGSMSGDKIQGLKSAVETFVNNKDADVKVGIVSFDDDKLEQGSTRLGSTDAQLKQAVNEMADRGGTNIYSGVSDALSQMQPSDSINVIILMSDGQDNNPVDEATMDKIRQDCGDREVMIYTMGLGNDVDSAELSRYSNAGGGSYTFVSDSDTLLSFYNYLYAISRNRFRVTYNAEDTIQTSRRLRAEYHDDAKVFDERDYYLYDNSSLDGDDVGESYSLALEGVTLGGLDTRLLYKSVLDQEVRLLGSGLTEDLDIKVSIKSGTTYDLECSYESDNAWKVVIPSTASCGDYDVVVTVNGKRGVFRSGLIITSNKLNVIRFGQYIFEATSVGKIDNAITLSGYVQMNGWLGFTGNVTLSGDPNKDESIALSAPTTFVRYRKGEKELNGLAKFMSEHGSVVNLYRISDLKLYRNADTPPSSDEFRVDQMVVPGFMLQNLFELETPGLSLYPDRMEIDFNKFSTKFPFQDKLLKSGGLDKIFRFDIDHEEKLIVSQFAIDCDLELKVGSTDKDSYDEVPVSSNKKINAFFGNFRLLANLDEFNLKINTRDNDYSFKIAVNIAMLSDGLGLELKWSGGQFDAAKIFADFDINTVIGGVPTTFSDFSLGVAGLADAGSKGWDLTGGCKISFVKVSEYLPGLEDYIDDVSVFSLDNVELTLHFGEFRMALSADFKLFEAVELGHAKIQMGMGIPYSNTLLGYDGESVNGVVGEVGVGIKFDTSNLNLDIGASIELALTNRVIGLTAEGHIKYDVHWWIFGTNDKFSGKVFLGCYQKHNQKYAFALMFQGNGNEATRFEWDVDKVIA